jgi:nucleoside-diphosphate-sugar epimerase
MNHDKKTILVTGASGFIGRAFCAAALAAGHIVLAASRSGQDLPPGVLPVVIGDLTEGADFADVLRGVDVVVHLAARAHVLREEASDPQTLYRKVNVEATLALAAQCVPAGVRRFVFLSSIGVNGNRTSGRPFDESSPPQPHDLYAQSKLEAEQGLQKIAQESGLEVTIIRPPLVYGPNAKGNFASLLRLVQRGLPLPLGSINNARSFIALDNLVSFIVLCADPDRSPKAANQVFLICDGEDVSTTELLRKVARAQGVGTRLLPVPETWLRFAARCLGKRGLETRLLDSLVIDASKARRLGWQPVLTMDEQLRKIANNAQNT